MYPPIFMHLNQMTQQQYVDAFASSQEFKKYYSTGPPFVPQNFTFVSFFQCYCCSTDGLTQRQLLRTLPHHRNIPYLLLNNREDLLAHTTTTNTKYYYTTYSYQSTETTKAVIHFREFPSTMQPIRSIGGWCSTTIIPISNNDLLLFIQRWFL